MAIRKDVQIYIAGKFSARERLREHRDRLRADGWNVVASWLASEEDSLPNPGNAIREASRDMAELIQADVLFLDTFDESNTGGREVELGIAFARGHLIWMVGPTRNVFHHLVPAKFDTWEAVYDALRASY